MSLLKSSADRVIANAPIIINRDSELYQRYWKQRLPRRVSTKTIQSEEEEDSEKVVAAAVQQLLAEEELINSVPESLPLVQIEDEKDEDVNQVDNQAQASILDETVVKQDRQSGPNQVYLSKMWNCRKKELLEIESL